VTDARICPICNGSSVRVLDVSYPFFRHMDFATIKTNGTLGQCCTCQTLFQVINDVDLAKIEGELNNETYMESSQTNQTVTIENSDSPATRSVLQAQLIKHLVSNRTPKILDIGCFDGELLLQLQHLYPRAVLHGFDRNEGARQYFPTMDNFHFWAPDLRAIQEKFDIITLSHSMPYEQNIRHLMNEILRLLDPKGTLFIQLPDIAMSPWLLLMADQYYYYSLEILTATLRRFGFTISSSGSKWFPREIVVEAKIADSPWKAPSGKRLEFYLQELDEKVERLKLIRATQIGVLGTTSAAAFVDSIYGENISYFVDENPSKVGADFRGKHVLHPNMLQDGNTVVIPYGISGRQIKNRFTSKYSGEFIIV